MIKQSTIDEIRNKADLTEQVEKIVPVKDRKACCPLHDEKTASFTITKDGSMFKCFGCGESGDVFSFIQKTKKFSFTEAAEWLASFYNITVEYDQVAKQEAAEKKEARTEMLSVVSFAQTEYTKALRELPDYADAIRYLNQRGYTRQRAEKWSLGVAPDNWRFMSYKLINMGKHTPAVDCGILATKEGQTWDFYRNRITIPIHDHNGILIGLAGRIIPALDAEKKSAKYVNPCESLLYDKKKVWYGLWQAQKAIKTKGFVYITEGYFDVQSMHDAGFNNTVSSSGTEIDELQAKFLKRYTDTVCICMDADEPGLRKVMGDGNRKSLIDLFLKLDFRVQVIELPDKLDPDEFIRTRRLLLTEKESTI